MQQTWVRVGSRSWWWTGKPGVLKSMGSQRVGHAWATELSWTEPLTVTFYFLHILCLECTNMLFNWNCRKYTLIGWISRLPSTTLFTPINESDSEKLCENKGKKREWSRSEVGRSSSVLFYMKTSEGQQGIWGVNRDISSKLGSDCSRWKLDSVTY